MKFALKSFLIILFLTVSLTDAQSVSIGGFIGGGTVGGFAATTGAFTSSLFAEVNTPYFGFNPRLSFVYAQDFNALLPGSTNKYFPFLKAYSLKAILTQPLKEPFFLEEGFGPEIINDRTFSNVNEWNYGIAISIETGMDFRKKNPNGFKAGVGAEFSITFGNTFAQYLSVHLQGQYYF